MDTQKTLILIDGNSLMNRAYYAIQTPMISGEGVYTQGIFGFLNMLNKLLKDYKPTHLAVAFDRKSPTFRHLEYDDYKAGRRKMPPELAMQFPYLKEILQARNIAILEIDGFEADDILGTVSFDAEQEGFRTYIITGDKDAFQLASDKTTVIYTKRGISEFDAYDEQMVHERYGISPTQFIDLKGLMGDSSDNLPGIPGVGEKTAIKLLLEYGSVEGLIQNVDGMKKSKLKERIEENAQLAVMSKRLATIERHVPLEYAMEDLLCEEPDYDALIELYKKLSLNSFLRKLSKEMNETKKASDAETTEAENGDGLQEEEELDTSDRMEPDRDPDFDRDCLADALSKEELKARSEAARRARIRIAAIPKLDPDLPVTRVTSAGQLQEICERLLVWSDGQEKAVSEASPWTGASSTLQTAETENALADAEIAAGAGDSTAETGEMVSSAVLWLHVFHDDRHVGRPTIFSVCLAGAEQFWLIPWDAWCVEPLAHFFAAFSGMICGHELQKSYFSLISNGVNLSPETRDHLFETGFDTAVAAYLTDPQKRSYELSVLLLEEFHQEFPTDKKIQEEVSVIDLFGDALDRQERYGKSILTGVSKLIPILTRRMEEQELLYVFERIELPLVEVLADMESAGIRADARVLEEIGSALVIRIDELTAEIHDLAGEAFNINSPKQLGSILFEKLGLKNGKKTKTGYSTSADVLNKIIDQHPIVPMILEYRMLTKLNGTYVDGMLPLIDEDSRIHAHFQQTVTTTGRLSCTEPNLQNIPIRQELGRQLRRVFTASSSDRTLVGADYSQVELRVMAHLSGDEALLESFAENQDIHAATAARVFQVPLDEVTPLQRRHAKAVNFGVIYGISSFGLAEDLKVTRKKAQEYIDEYFLRHPDVKAFMDHMVEYCRQHHYVTTLSGRRRTIPEISARNYMTRQLGERLAMNTPVQGTAADIIKVAMIRVYRRIRQEKLDARLILQVHDELILESGRSDQEKVAELLEDCMTNAVSLKVPLSVEVNIADDWYQLK